MRDDDDDDDDERDNKHREVINRERRDDQKKRTYKPRSAYKDRENTQTNKEENEKQKGEKVGNGHLLYLLLFCVVC